MNKDLIINNLEVIQQILKSECSIITNAKVSNMISDLIELLERED